MTKEIELTQGYVALVDDEDYEWVSRFKWYAHWEGRQVYAKTNVRQEDGRQRQATLRMHRLIMDPPDGADVDHVNGNGLDNRRENLRLCTRSQNMANQPAHANNTSGYKGVHWHKIAGKWLASIRVMGRRLHLGYHETPQAAALAYNEAALEHFGRFAYLNDVHMLA